MASVMYLPPSTGGFRYEVSALRIAPPLDEDKGPLEGVGPENRDIFGS
jgi:hypothetical protein